MLGGTRRSLIELSDYSDYSKTGFTATGEDYWRKCFFGSYVYFVSEHV